MPGIFSNVFGDDGSQTSETTAILEGAHVVEASPELEVGYEASYEDLEGGSHTMAGELAVGADVNVEAAYQAGVTLAGQDYSAE